MFLAYVRYFLPHLCKEQKKKELRGRYLHSCIVCLNMFKLCAFHLTTRESCQFSFLRIFPQSSYSPVMSAFTLAYYPIRFDLLKSNNNVIEDFYLTVYYRGGCLIFWERGEFAEEIDLWNDASNDCLRLFDVCV